MTSLIEEKIKFLEGKLVDTDGVVEFKGDYVMELVRQALTEVQEAQKRSYIKELEGKGCNHWRELLQ